MKKHNVTLNPENLANLLSWKDRRVSFDPRTLKRQFDLSEQEQEQARLGIWPKAEISQSIGEPVSKKRYKARSGYEGVLNLDRYQSYSQEPYDTRKKRKTYKPCRIGIQCNLSAKETNDRLAGICGVLAESCNQLAEAGYSVSIDTLYYGSNIFTLDKNEKDFFTLNIKTEETDYNALEILSHRSFPRLSTFVCLKSYIDSTGRSDFREGLGRSLDGLPEGLEADYDIIIPNTANKDTVRQAIQSLLDQ